eukprot:m.99197 g.99197  ORF g.99197 m.99197 type:complete len:128 (-) comp15581_c0_seq1:272-655(-)
MDTANFSEGTNQRAEEMNRNRELDKNGISHDILKGKGDESRDNREDEKVQIKSGEEANDVRPELPQGKDDVRDDTPADNSRVDLQPGKEDVADNTPAASAAGSVDATNIGSSGMVDATSTSAQKKGQ